MLRAGDLTQEQSHLDGEALGHRGIPAWLDRVPPDGYRVSPSAVAVLAEPQLIGLGQKPGHAPVAVLVVQPGPGVLPESVQAGRNRIEVAVAVRSRDRDHPVRPRPELAAFRAQVERESPVAVRLDL